jgi:hypothetical protein
VPSTRLSIDIKFPLCHGRPNNKSNGSLSPIDRLAVVSTLPQLSGTFATKRECSEDPWLGQTTDDIVETTVPSLLVPSLPNMEVRQPSEGAIWSCDSILIWEMMVARYLYYFQ